MRQEESGSPTYSHGKLKARSVGCPHTETPDTNPWRHALICFVLVSGVDSDDGTASRASSQHSESGTSTSSASGSGSGTSTGSSGQEDTSTSERTSDNTSSEHSKISDALLLSNGECPSPASWRTLFFLSKIFVLCSLPHGWISYRPTRWVQPWQPYCAKCITLRALQKPALVMLCIGPDSSMWAVPGEVLLNVVPLVLVRYFGEVAPSNITTVHYLGEGFALVPGYYYPGSLVGNSLRFESGGLFLVEFSRVVLDVDPACTAGVGRCATSRSRAACVVYE